MSPTWRERAGGLSFPLSPWVGLWAAGRPCFWTKSGERVKHGGWIKRRAEMKRTPVKKRNAERLKKRREIVLVEQDPSYVDLIKNRLAAAKEAAAAAPESLVSHGGAK